MSGKIKLPHCRDRWLISCTQYYILRENKAFKTMNIKMKLKGENMRKFMLKWMIEQCNISKETFVSNLIILHSEVDHYGQNDGCEYVRNLQNDACKYLNISEDKNICNRTSNFGYGCVHGQSLSQSKTFQYQPY